MSEENMKSRRTVLIVEDDADTVDSWRRDLRDFNQACESVEFVPTYAPDAAGANSQIESTMFDCAIVDLRLPKPKSEPCLSDDDAAGNALIEKIVTEIGIPVVIHSGYPDEQREALRAFPVRCFLKQGGSAMSALGWLCTQDGLMEALAATRRRLREETARVFSQSIWKRWDKRWQNADKENVSTIVARQIAAHLAETIGTPADIAYHPEEFYFVPPLEAGRLATGDLLQVDGRILVVLTPRCNLANTIPPTFVFAECEALETWWNAMKDRLSGEGNKDKPRSELSKYATQNLEISKHFLPKCDQGGPWLVNFKNIITYPAERLPELLKARFASVSPQFVPNLVQRYAAYQGRIGQPNLDIEQLIGQMDIKNACQPAKALPARK
jgi:CheY-like chemotaxis protein